jgi:hypothetical protein
MDRSFDIAYWQRLGPAAIFEAAWQMAVDAHSLTPGGPHAPRLRRTLAGLSIDGVAFEEARPNRRQSDMGAQRA